jgi:prepilin-type N-terminal cleavage/methylation domain-containing protein
MKQRCKGYSLVEVLVAIAITSVVLLTVVTLFYMGRRNVYSGKQTTVAVSIGTRVLEDLSTMTAEDIRTHFKIDDTSRTTVTLRNVPAAGTTGANAGNVIFADSVQRDTSGCTLSGSGSTAKWDCGTNDVDGYLSKWMSTLSTETNAAVDKSERLSNPVIGLVITPRDPSDTDKPVTTARFTKVRAYVAWDESQRRRYAFFDTMKVGR